MTKNSILCIFGLIHEAFGDSATRIPNIYTMFCNSGRRGVVDTSLEYDCQLSYWHLAIVFFLYFTLEFLYQLWLKHYLFLLLFFFHTKLQKKKKMMSDLVKFLGHV